MSWSAPNLPADKHRFFDRRGGVSNGRYESLNFNRKSADKPENIKQNIVIAAGCFGLTPEAAAFPCQGVTGHAEYVGTPSLHKIEADAFVTDNHGILLGITTADCAPVLFADFKNGVIGAAHAGWRGAVRGIMENTLALMRQHGAELNHIAAAVGPCLQKNSFETRADMLGEFLAQDSENQKFFTPTDAGSYLFDMEQYLIFRLHKAGIENIAVSGIDTLTDQDYFSYRRECRLGNITRPADFPVQLSTITL